jgi:hypothetical protein
VRRADAAGRYRDGARLVRCRREDSRMRVTMSTLACLLVVAACGAAHAGDAKPQAASPGHHLLASMEVIVAADGSVASVTPDAALPEPIRQMLVKRVSQWRYSVPMWQGKPVQLSTRLKLRLQPVPTTSGGMVLRVLGGSNELEIATADAAGIIPPRYPHGAAIKKIGGTFTYVVRVQPDGSASNVRRVLPLEPTHDYFREMDESAQAALRSSRFPSSVVDGSAIACDRMVPIVFMPPDQPPVPQDATSAKDAIELRCPTATLETRIENLIL